jgi:hypothetical protein
MHIFMYTYAYMYFFTYICIYLYMYAYTYLSTHLCMYVYMYVCTHSILYALCTNMAVCLTVSASITSPSSLIRTSARHAYQYALDVVWRLHCCLSSASVLPLSKTPHLLHSYFRDAVRTPWSPTNSWRISTSTKTFIWKYLIALPASTFTRVFCRTPSLTGLYHTLTVEPRGYITTQTIYNFPITQWNAGWMKLFLWYRLLHYIL